MDSSDLIGAGRTDVAKALVGAITSRGGEVLIDGRREQSHASRLTPWQTASPWSPRIDWPRVWSWTSGVKQNIRCPSSPA